MSDFTIVNLTEVDDSAPRFGYAEIGAARFARASLDAEQVGVALHQLKPGRRQAFGHRHDQAEEVYVVISGSGRVRLDDEISAVSTHDAIRVAPQVTRGFEAGDDGLEILVFGQHFDNDGELVHDWWTD